MIICRHQLGAGSWSPWLQQGRQVKGRHGRPEFLSRSSPQKKNWKSPTTLSAWSDSPVKGIFCFILSVMFLHVLIDSLFQLLSSTWIAFLYTLIKSLGYVLVIQRKKNQVFKCRISISFSALTIMQKESQKMYVFIHAEVYHDQYVIFSLRKLSSPPMIFKVRNILQEFPHFCFGFYAPQITFFLLLPLV